jgi:hypothetical protein
LTAPRASFATPAAILSRRFTYDPIHFDPRRIDIITPPAGSMNPPTGPVPKSIALIGSQSPGGLQLQERSPRRRSTFLVRPDRGSRNRQLLEFVGLSH